MNNSPTEGEQVQTASVTEPTVNEQVQQPAAEQNQETISHEQSQEAVSQTTAGNNNNEGASQNDDDGLAKFAKAQGFDPDNLSDDVKRALKIAHDNQKAYRNSTPEKKVTEVAQELEKPKENETEDEAFRREFKQYKYEQQTSQFWGEDGRDKTLEPTMVEILNEKKAQYGADYARNLSHDLPTLYDLARLRNGAVGGQVDTEAIRREERESIKKAQTASSGQPHAVTQNNNTTPKIDREWLSTQYDPSNPEHRKMVDEAVANGDL